MIDKEHIDERLSVISDISSPYAPTHEGNFNLKKKNMENELHEIESSLNERTPLFHYKIAIAYRNFCSWYIRGDDRKIYLNKVIEHLEKTITNNANSIDSKVELASILIQEKLVRNLDKALKLIVELKEAKGLPAWMNSLEEKAKRWQGDIDLPNDTDFSKLDPTPAVLKEERTKLRKQLVESMKNDSDSQQIIAHRLYNLGLFVAYLYDSYDCNSGIIGNEYDNAVKIAKNISKKFNYKYFGRIEGADFLTEQDYKRIEKALGGNKGAISIPQIKNML